MNAQKISPIVLDEADHQLFARLSGDRNPTHIDPLAARRSIFGRVVVHGMHCVLAGLEATYEVTAEQRKDLPSGGLSVRFLKPVFPGERIEISVAESATDNLYISARKGEIEFAEIALLPGKTSPVSLPSGSVPANMMAPADKPIEELINDSGEVGICVEPDAVRRKFPHCSSVLGVTRVCEIMALSQIIGMCCPGRHGVTTGLSVQFSESKEKTGLFYSVKRLVDPVSLLQLSVSGRTLAGQLEAFHLPPPSSVSFKSLTQRLSPGSMKDRVVLVIGGSRGLGEALAKIFAAAGAEVVLTFRVGRAEAKQIVTEITEGGGRCHALHFDTASPEACLAKWPSSLPAPTNLFYLATPKIFDKRSERFDTRLLKSFEVIYVEGFAATCKAALKRFNGPLEVFYPSIVAIDEDDPRLTEYAMAKRRGEEICWELENQFPCLSIHVARIPRLSTDQTINFAGVSGGDPTAVLLPILAEMSMVSLDELLMQPDQA